MDQWRRAEGVSFVSQKMSGQMAKSSSRMWVSGVIPQQTCQWVTVRLRHEWITVTDEELTVYKPPQK